MRSHVIDLALHVNFPDVEWYRLQQIYGWAALQFQAWARGQLTIVGDRAKTVILHAESILEYCVDGVPYFGGDYYGYRRAPLVLNLEPGGHTVDVRVVRDVRTMGGMSSSMSIRIVAETSPGGLVVKQKELLISDVVNDTLASPWASLPARNDGNVPLEIRHIESTLVST